MANIYRGHVSQLHGANTGVGIRGYGNDLGRAETRSELVTRTYLFNGRGADSIQDLDANVRIHELEVTRVWFTLPDGVSPPADGTFWLLFKNGFNSPLGNSEYEYARTDKEWDFATSSWIDFESTNDPTQQDSNAVEPYAVAIIPGGSAAGVRQILWENTSHLSHRFIGDSRGVKKLRIQLADSQGTLLSDLEETRIFVECIITGELRA